MTDYDELVKALREHKCDANDEDDTSICAFCAYEVAVDNKWVCVCGLMNQAADAIEELSKRVSKTPHGRLIDADALDREFTALRWDDNVLAHWGDRKDWCLQGSEIEALISAAPTIIPAEEGE